MIRKLFCAAALLALSFGVAVAEPVKGRIISINGNKVTVLVGAKKDVKGEEKVYDLGKDVKVSKAMGKDKIEPLAGGLGAAELKNIDAKKGIGAMLEVNGTTVSEITIVAGKKKE